MGFIPEGVAEISQSDVGNVLERVDRCDRYNLRKKMVSLTVYQSAHTNHVLVYSFETVGTLKG
jgi:RNase P/RNase MRP subunit POP5